MRQKILVRMRNVVFALVVIISFYRPFKTYGQCNCDPISPPGGSETVVTVDSLAGIQAEIGNAVGPKTIYLESGMYYVTPSSFVNVYKPDITIRSVTGNRDDVVIQGEGMDASGGTGHGIFINASNSTIADLTIMEIQNHGVFVNPGSHNLLVHNIRCVDIGEQLFKASGDTSLSPKNNGIIECSVFEYTDTLDDGDDGWYTNGIDLLNSHGWIIRDNVIRNIKHNPAITSNLAGPAILIWQGSSNTIIERNRIIDCDFGISFGNAGGSGIQHTGGIIRNNFIKGYHFSDFGIGIIKSDNAVVINNTVFSPGGWPYSIEARFSETTNCLVINNFTDEPIYPDRNGASVTETTNNAQAEAVHFADSDEGDLTLISDQVPAVNAGTQDSNRTADINCNTVSDSQPDAGAHEYGAESIVDDDGDSNDGQSSNRGSDNEDSQGSQDSPAGGCFVTFLI